MNIEKFKPLTKGILKRFLVKRKYDTSTGGTTKNRYCYSVWMRHLVFAHHNGIKNLRGTAVELGPGDSLGIGFTALLTGFDRYFALDVHKFWNTERNLQVFDELVVLLKNRTDIPGNDEFSRVTPSLENYAFPAHILTDSLLAEMLAPERIERIRNEIANLDHQNRNAHVNCIAPWDENVLKENSVDFVYSQAVLQYANDLDAVYKAMNKWLKKDGIMSHSIDFSSHGFTKSWNGHWLFTDWEWKLIHGNNNIILNREPQSTHLRLNNKYHFDVVGSLEYKKESPLSTKHFSKKFKNLIDKDVKTSVMVIQSKKLLTFVALYAQNFIYKYHDVLLSPLEDGMMV